MQNGATYPTSPQSQKWDPNETLKINLQNRNSTILISQHFFILFFGIFVAYPFTMSRINRADVLADDTLYHVRIQINNSEFRFLKTKHFKLWQNITAIYLKKYPAIKLNDYIWMNSHAHMIIHALNGNCIFCQSNTLFFLNHHKIILNYFFKFIADLSPINYIDPDGQIRFFERIF